jgi:hypothetical protein
MKNYLWLFMVLFLGACACLQPSPPKPLQDPVITANGLTVQISGSDVLEEKAQGVPRWFPEGGCSYRIDWGDGKADPQYQHPVPVYCVSNLRHTYARPGQYRIKIGTAPYNWGLSTMPGQYGETVISVRK